MLDESWLTDKCLGVNALINEAHSQIALHHDKHFESDMSILFYMSVIENLQVGASQILNLMSSKLPYQQYAQLISECRDMLKDNSELLFCVANEYLNTIKADWPNYCLSINMIAESKKILVVDDDQDIREIIMYILESEGYQVSGLDNGSGVLESVSQIRPDVLLLDVQLGVSDGRDIAGN